MNTNEKISNLRDDLERLYEMVNIQKKTITNLEEVNKRLQRDIEHIDKQMEWYKIMADQIHKQYERITGKEYAGIMRKLN